MPLAHIFSFLTYPNKNKPAEPLAPGTVIPINDGKLCRMMGDIFSKAGDECLTPIMFTPTDGKQENQTRSEIIALIKKPGIQLAAALAKRLQMATGGSSGMGLMFICIGSEGKSTRIVLSRFPADEGVVAETKSRSLSVEFVEQVFMKSSYSYKAVTYLHHGKANDAWSGHAVDKQLNHGAKEMANYWIVDFLMSDLATTAAAGTKRLALALRRATAESSDPDIKAEIAAAVRLAGNLPKNALSIDEFCRSFQLSQKTRDVISAKVNPSRLLREQFKFDGDEFSKHIRYSQVELDTGVTLSAPVDKFDEVIFAVEDGGVMTYTTSGTVVDQRLKTNR